MAPSYLRWPPDCTPIELYDVSGEVTTIPDGEVCELDAWPWHTDYSPECVEGAF
jgi:hypothetical protein